MKSKPSKSDAMALAGGVGKGITKATEVNSRESRRLIREGAKANPPNTVIADPTPLPDEAGVKKVSSPKRKPSGWKMKDWLLAQRVKTARWSQHGAALIGKVKAPSAVDRSSAATFQVTWKVPQAEGNISNWTFRDLNARCTHAQFQIAGDWIPVPQPKADEAND